MNNKDIIKLFLQDPNVQKFINNNDWSHIYNSPNKYTSVNFLWDHPDMEDDIIGEFTCMLLNLGIDPLKHMKNVPEAYLREINISTMLDITRIELPEGIESIDSCAFYECKGLSTVVIPKSVKEIKSEVFTDSDLEQVIYTGTTKDWINIEKDITNPFYHTQDDIPIICSNGTLYEHG